MSEENNKVPFVELSAEELEKVALELQERETALQENEATQKVKEDLLLGKEIELNKKQKELDKKEKDLAKKSATPKESKPEPGLEGEFEEETYKFLDSAPKVISINGKGYTQQEIFDDPDLALVLIGGNSGLIIKI